MPFNQTRDVLDHARNFHCRLSDFYAGLRNSARKESTRDLLDYMSRHEQRLEKHLAEYQELVSENVLDTYFKYESEAGSVDEIAQFEIKPDMSVDDVINTVMHFNTCLIKFYREMAQQAMSKKIREIFENLLSMEEHEQIELSKKVLELGSL